MKFQAKDLPYYAIAVFIVFVGYQACDRNTIPPARPSCTRIDAIVSAQGNVKAQLKNPDEAVFSNSAAWDVKQEGDVFTVIGEVTATNSFNAKLKQTFTAQVKCSPDGWHYGSVVLQ